MRLKKFIQYNESVNLTDSIFKDLEIYLLKNIGPSIKNKSLTAEDFKYYSQFYNIKDSEEFLKFFPIKNSQARNLIETFFNNLEPKKLEQDQKDALEKIYKKAEELIEKNKLSNVNLEMKDDYFSVKIVLPRRSKLTDLIRITSFLKSLDVSELIELSELELWKNQKNEPMLIVDFYLDEPESDLTNKYPDVPF